MTGPSWLAGHFAAVMILTGAYSASRLAVSRLRGRATEFDADALHAVMGAAMAGMLVPRLNVLPDSAWMAVFGIAAAWFGWHAVRTRGARTSAGSPGRFPVPHLIECVAMLYMLLPLHGSRPAYGGAGMAMAGMGASAGLRGQFPGTRGCPRPVHARLHRVDHRPADIPGPGQNHPGAARTAAPPRDDDDAPGTPAGAGTRPGARLAGQCSPPRSPRAASSR